MGLYFSVSQLIVHIILSDKSADQARCRMTVQEVKMIIIDYRDTRPIYEQVVEKFKVLILKGGLKADEQMPTVRSLAMELSINPNTIQKAYSELERQGYIYTVRGRGNFVASPEQLKKDRMDECRSEVIEKAREAMEFGVSKEQLVEDINGIPDVRCKNDRDQ